MSRDCIDGIADRLTKRKNDPTKAQEVSLEECSFLELYSVLDWPMSYQVSILREKVVLEH